MATSNALVGEGVRFFRRRHGLSQEDVASRMRDGGHDWHQTTVSKVEGGTRPLMLDEAVAVCSILGVKPWDLLEG